MHVVFVHGDHQSSIYRIILDEFQFRFFELTFVPIQVVLVDSSYLFNMLNLVDSRYADISHVVESNVTFQSNSYLLEDLNTTKNYILMCWII